MTAPPPRSRPPRDAGDDSLSGRFPSRAPAPSTIVAIAEIDRFGDLRRRVGYSFANRLVEELAERIRAGLPGCQTGRVGRTSVEFSFGATSREDARASLEALVTGIERPFAADGYAFDLTVTIGAADAGGGLVDDEQLDSAAAAVAQAQEQRQKVFVTGEALRDGDGIDELKLIRDLRAAIGTDQLTLHYQPKLRSRTETIDSAEALLRWVHPTTGPVRTDKLIELAEATGAIRELTFWVLDRAIADRATLAAAGHPLVIFVNISGVLLADAGFADRVLARLATAEGIGLEITETAVINDPAMAIGNLHRFAAAGAKIAIDDYGSGLSSLAYLKQLPAHELKIDRMFVQGLTESHRDPLLVRSSIDLAHALEMEVTAEGVDDPMALSLLRVMGCDLIQGYLVSPPLPLAEMTTFLVENRHQNGLRAIPADLHGWTLAASAKNQP